MKRGATVIYGTVCLCIARTAATPMDDWGRAQDSSRKQKTVWRFRRHSTINKYKLLVSFAISSSQDTDKTQYPSQAKIFSHKSHIFQKAFNKGRPGTTSPLRLPCEPVSGPTATKTSILNSAYVCTSKSPLPPPPRAQITLPPARFLSHRLLPLPRRAHPSSEPRSSPPTPSPRSCTTLLRTPPR